MIYVPPLHAELMSTTALTPTHHKSAVRTVATIAVAIAIPAVAPSIATSIGLSTALGGGVLGSTLGSAVVGTALGALAAKVTGQPVLQGALGGAFVGGVGGFADAGGFSGISGGGGSAPTGFQGGGGGIPFGGSAGDFAGLSAAQLSGTPIAAAAPAGLTTGVAPGSSVGGFDALGQPVTGGFFGPEGFVATDPPLGDIYGGSLLPSQALPPTPGFVEGPVSGPDQFGVIQRPVSLTAPTSTSVAPPGTGRSFIGPDDFTGLKPTQLSGAPAAPVPAATIVGGASQPPGFFDDFGKNVTAGLKRAFDPANLAQKGVEAAGQFGFSKAAEYFADDVPEEMSPEAEAFLRQQRAQQGRLLGEQEKIALQLANEARSVPVSGQAESNRAKIAAARAGQTYIRQGSQAPAAVAARRRQVALAAARRGGTAQIQGRTGGLARRADFLTAAAGTLPTGQELASGAAADLAAADKAFLRREKALQEQRQNFAAVFGGLLPAGEDTDEEIEEAQARRT